MTKSNHGPFTHHERLRYSYLLKNLERLRGGEISEFNYLQEKLDAYEAQRAYQAYEASEEARGAYHQEPYQAYPPAPDYEGAYRQAPVKKTAAEGLPLYQEEPRKPVKVKSRTKKPSRATKPSKSAVSKKKRPASKKKMTVKRFLKLTGLALAVLIVVVFVGIVRSFMGGMDLSANGNNGQVYQPAVQEVFNGQDTKDGINILVLGSDQRVTQGSTDARTDSIMVVNVGNKEGKIKMVSFMRDTLVNIRGASETDYMQDLKLNTAFNIGEQNNNQGAELMRETLKRNYDIDIKYYVMVDFETFASAIDELFPDGVDINAKFGTVDGQKVSEVDVPDDLRMDANGNVPDQTIKVGKQKMDGRTLLNYARFRKDDDGDFGRTQRQQQVMQAIVNQVKNPASLFTGASALGKVYALTSTNLSLTDILDLGLSNAANFSKGVESQTIPEEGDWIDNYDMYGGQALEVDFDKYQEQLAKLGFR